MCIGLYIRITKYKTKPTLVMYFLFDQVYGSSKIAYKE